MAVRRRRACSYLREYEHLTLATASSSGARIVSTGPGLLGRLPAPRRRGAAARLIEILVAAGAGSPAARRARRRARAPSGPLELAEPEGYVRTFVDEGPPLAALLRATADGGIAPRYVARLLAAFPSTPPPSGAGDLVEPLSDREQDVLRLLGTDLSGPEIAREWRTITGWLALMGAVFFLAIAAGGTFVDDFSSPGSQSATALELLDENFPEAAKGSAMVVLAARDGTTLDDHQGTIAQVLDDVSDVAHVESVADPFAAGTISEDGRIGFAVMTLDAPEREIGKPAFAVLSEAVSAMGAPGLQVELGGDAVFLNAAEETSSHTAIGLLVALLVLLVVFGTVVAAIVPIGLSLVAVGASIGGIMLMASTMNVSVSAIAVAGLVGLGVGVDYALFIVARYRENRSAGQDNTRALSNAMATSGTAVVFAGGTVMIATAALGITGLGILTSIGLSTALMVLIAVAAAVTLLPALLTLLGDRIDAGRRGAARTDPPSAPRTAPGGDSVTTCPVAPGPTSSVRSPCWPHSLRPPCRSRRPSRRRATPPPHTTHRQAYDLLTEGFGIGFNAPLMVVMDLESSAAGPTTWRPCRRPSRTSRASSP